MQIAESVQGASKATPTAAAAARRDGNRFFCRGAVQTVSPQLIFIQQLPKYGYIAFVKTKKMYFSPSHFNISHCSSETGFQLLYKTSRPS